MSCTVFLEGKIWHYRFQLNGKRIQRTTHERNERRARAAAQAAYDDAVCRVNGGQPTPTLSELIAEWIEIQSPVKSVGHVRGVEAFARLHLYDLGDMKITDISTRHVELARNRHLATRKPASANHWLRILKLLCNWAVGRDIMPKMPWKVSMIKVQKTPRAILPVVQADAWFAAVDKLARRRPAVGTAIRLMFGMGLRESEVATARWEWFDWERQTYTPGITKGREAEATPVPGWLVDYLAPLRKEAGLMVTKVNGRQFKRGFARRTMLAANAVCGTPGITPHRLRGSYATLLSEAGVPVQVIQGLMRHKDPLTTFGYLEKNKDIAVKALEKIGDMIGFARRKTGDMVAAG